MAAVVEVPPAQLPEGSANPRKRKKRAPATGAANDCFKCAERKITCDRRRPYCSQCLDSGQDCSGYKTQLTWGVGVASRGKLRGLSLPVAGTQRAPGAESAPKTKKRRDTSAEKPQFASQELREARPIVPSNATPQTPSSATFKTDPGTIWDPTLFSAPHSFDLNYTVNTTQEAQLYSKPAPVTPTYGSAPQSTSFRDDVWRRAPSTTYLSPASVMTPTVGPHDASASYFEHRTSFSTSPALVSPTEPIFGDLNGRRSTQPEPSLDGISMLLQAGQSIQLPQTNLVEQVDQEFGREQVDQQFTREQYDECAVVDDLPLVSTSPPLDFHFSIPILPGLGAIGKTPRMQYLINYYAEVISPVIVAFDSPSNPFRTQILRLAESSETLQHAISALAASNLRQRRGIGLLSTGKTAPARRSSFAHVHLTNDYSQALLSPEEQIREETLHKRLAVSQLNQQLAHPVLRKDDSILATLLILCLFHICDSGVAKFQTQFAGVRKLLALRGDNMKIGNEDSKWMARLFTWFDSLAATVNDREGQITGQYLDVSALCGDWSLENMAGIDAQLFRSISKLGRLNLLMQGKAVETNKATLVTPLPPPAFGTDAYATLDGNGWISQGTGIGLGINEEDKDNKQFWQEWREVRHELLSWNLDTTLFDSLSRESSYLTADQRVDLENISQSFRYSALLYMERLAQPHLPSSDEAIQRWVRQSLNHIKQVVSDVYLLWPLFITGTECIADEERDIIRGRCQDIQKDSGFVNNASCLLLLEKVWRVNSPQASPEAETFSSPSNRSDSSTGSAFMFRDVMIKEAARTEGEGEYIVV